MQGSCFLWKIAESFLHCDHLDERWRRGAPGNALPREMLFLSRHASASGRPCLTVHPIGVPSASVSAEQLAKSGGRAGRCVPPSPRIGHLYRRLRALKKGGGSVPPGFEVSLEATHHGPFAETPSAFVEIGSTEAEWSRADAAEPLVSALLGELAGELAGEVETRRPDGKGSQCSPVVIGLGGGHYTPKMGDVAGAGAAVGHILSSYAIAFAPPADGGPVGAEEGLACLMAGGGGGAILEAVESTRRSFGGALLDGDGAEPAPALLVQVDKKGFGKKWQRDAVLALLEREGLSWRLK